MRSLSYRLTNHISFGRHLHDGGEAHVALSGNFKHYLVVALGCYFGHTLARNDTLIEGVGALGPGICILCLWYIRALVQILEDDLLVILFDKLFKCLLRYAPRQ